MGLKLTAMPPRQALFKPSLLKLRTLFEAGDLPDVTNLQGPSESSLFTDNKGHGGQILKDLGELIWMDAIYGVDLSKYAYDSGYETDLKAIA